MKYLYTLLLCLYAVCTLAAQDTKPFVQGSLQSILSTHQGKPFILALWSLDCSHCRDDLALLGKLHQSHAEVEVVLVATDTPARHEEIEAVRKTYRLKHLESWVYADTFTERLRYEIDPQWYGELPRTYFFDAAGHALAISGKFNRTQLMHWIREIAKINPSLGAGNLPVLADVAKVLNV